MKAEIVAPAGNAKCLDAALKAGADAVYLGLNSFNARMKADNFDIENIKDLAAHIHSHNAKLYLTFNTIIKQSELDGAARLAARAFADGADAVIIQDLGLLRAVKEINPEIIIHASTQMGVHNTEGAEYIKSLGASRVILSRETPLKDIAEIKKTGLEIEVFVQGALCVSFSGNCYFSSLVSGHSGNRGRCLQLCRKAYKAVCHNQPSPMTHHTLTQGYLLSPKDICFASRVNELCAAGVDSFKIEGRMRAPEYVSAAVRVYKAALAGTVKEKEIEALRNAHSRGGFTLDYL